MTRGPSPDDTTSDGQGWKTLADLPSPRDATGALLVVESRAVSPVLRAIRSGDFGLAAARYECTGLERVFTLDRASHCFDVAPSSWAGFHETQVVRGLSHFLNSTRDTARVRAFLAAAYASSGDARLLSVLESAVLRGAEAIPEKARVDLVVEAVLADGTKLGVVIEAKLGHHLTRGQLPKAVKHAGTRELAESNTAFLVVLPDTDAVGTRVFSKSGNQTWRATSWWSLLREFERRLPEEADDDAFRGFRHTAWQRAYG